MPTTAPIVRGLPRSIAVVVQYARSATPQAECNRRDFDLAERRGDERHVVALAVREVQAELEIWAGYGVRPCVNVSELEFV